MKRLLFVSFILIAGCAPHDPNNSFNSAHKQAINQQMNEAAVEQQEYQTSLQSQSTYFGSGNFNTLPNTLK